MINNIFNTVTNLNFAAAGMCFFAGQWELSCTFFINGCVVLSVGMVVSIVRDLLR